MKKSDVVKLILANRCLQEPKNTIGKAFAPSNIALCKYWGKRDQELNLPVTSSLSISLGDKGAEVNLEVSNADSDTIILNGQKIDAEISFSKRLVNFLNLFCNNVFFKITIQSNIPIAAGLASSAAGFASIIKALDNLYGWQLTTKELSILARLGSGSAARSIWQGFVEWHAGERADGMDSYAEAIADTWPEFCIGLLILDAKEKSLSSREAMQRTVETSKLYTDWPNKVKNDLAAIKTAISKKHFALLAATAESNAINMHATMLDASPPINYALAETLSAMQKVWSLRKQGLAVYFTQDAGPNLKLLFLYQDAEMIKTHFPAVEIVQPFAVLKHTNFVE